MTEIFLLLDVRGLAMVDKAGGIDHFIPKKRRIKSKKSAQMGIGTLVA
jgi:hypothetical protein